MEYVQSTGEDDGVQRCWKRKETKLVELCYALCLKYLGFYKSHLVRVWTVYFSDVDADIRKVECF